MFTVTLAVAPLTVNVALPWTGVVEAGGPTTVTVPVAPAVHPVPYGMRVNVAVVSPVGPPVFEIGVGAVAVLPGGGVKVTCAS